MTKIATDLFSAAGLSAPASLDDLTTSGVVPPDFEIDSVDSHVEETTGPYERGETILTSVAFGGQQAGHSGNLASYNGNYTFTGSAGGEVTPKSSQTVLPTIQWEVSSSAANGDYTISVTYDEPFNSGATGIGVAQDLTVTVQGFNIDLSAGPLSSTEISLSLDIQSGTADYDVLIERSDTQGGPYDTTVVNTTETSTGTFSYTDSGLSSGVTYYYQVTVTEDSGNGQTLTDTDSGTTLAVS